MPTWHSLLNEIRARGSTFDVVRRERLKTLAEKTGRNVIIYYSGWLQKPKIPGTQVTDADKNGFMTVIHGLDRTKGLDLILHTPGGQVAATESLVDYARKMFGTNIEVFVPQIAMSAGTMIACAAKKIYMGKQSNLGPIDPQFNGIPAYGVIEEFERALSEIREDQSKIPIWQVIISKYHPTFIGKCQNAIEWSKQIVTDWLTTGMFDGEPNPQQSAETVVGQLTNRVNMRTHSRHLSAEKSKSYGLKIEDLESDNDLQDLVLTVHHCFMHTFSNSAAIKIVENHDGVAIVHQVQIVQKRQ